jgi:hypothetical protein
MDTRRQLHHLLDDMLSANPRTALIATKRMTGELSWIEQRAVGIARREGWTFARIARLLGRTRQSVHQRYGSMPAQIVSPRNNWNRAAQKAEADFVRLMREIDEDRRYGEEPVAW